MANELIINYPSGSTLYALLFDATGNVWNGSSFVAPGSATWTDYDIAMSEVATATGVYRGAMPAAAAGVYSFVVRKQAGGAPVVADITVGVGRIEWTGTAEIMPASTTNIVGGQINSVSGSVGGKVLGGGSDTITGVGASADVTIWKGDVPKDLDVNGNVMASATIADKRVSGFVGASGVAEAIAFDATMSPSFIGQSSVPYSPGISYDNTFINWTFVIEDGNSGIAFATVVTGSDAATDMLSLRDPVPDPGFVVTDDIAFLLLPFAPSGSGLTAQETVNAVYNLAPVGTPAAGSIGAELDSILNGLTGVGLIPLVYTVTEPGGIIPISGVTVELYTEEACLNCVRRGVTNSFGVITFWLTTTGTYWIKSAKDGYQFGLDSETVAI